MLEFTLLKCNWIQYRNIACKDLIGLCRILKENGVPDEAWEMYQGHKIFSSGASIYSIASVNVSSRLYEPDYLWPNVPDDSFD
ncbi:MAG TPA: hypothetical protein VNZ45_03015 [Bacteroidia bacterium]|jgi:hypothetical protein|nr:hypothetical protein [Bacteroidia bacterium]